MVIRATFGMKSYTLALGLSVYTLALGMALTLTFIIFRKFNKKSFHRLTSYNVDEILGFKKLFYFSLFKSLPFVQLLASFIGELIAGLIKSPIPMLLFCLVYPVIMGIFQLLNSKINMDCDLDLDMLAEVNSVFFASMPYSIVYFNLEAEWFANTLLGIKTFYKIFGFVLLPSIRYSKYIRHKREPRRLAKPQKLSQIVPAMINLSGSPEVDKPKPVKDFANFYPLEPSTKPDIASKRNIDSEDSSMNILVDLSKNKSEEEFEEEKKDIEIIKLDEEDEHKALENFSADKLIKHNQSEQNDFKMNKKTQKKEPNSQQKLPPSTKIGSLEPNKIARKIGPRGSLSFKMFINQNFEPQSKLSEKVFTLRIFLIQIFDCTTNISITAIVFLVNYLLIDLLKLKMKRFSGAFMFQISYRALVSFPTFNLFLGRNRN